MTILIAGAIVLGVPFAAIAGLILWQVGRRRDFLRARAHAAAQYGWFPAPANPWLAQIAGDLYQRGKPGEMIAGDFRGRGMCALDYTYTTTSSNGHTTTTSTHQVFVVALNLPVALPPLSLTKESGVRRMLGGRDLELESKLFNDEFRVTCADDRYASAVLHPRLMEWMLVNPGLEWHLAGNALVSWGTGSYLIPDVLARLEVMSRLIDLIPPFVLRDYGQPVH